MRGLKFLLLTVSALAAFAVFLIISSTDPFRIDTPLLLMFYLAVFFFITSGFSLIRLSIFTEKNSHSYISNKGIVLSTLRLGVILSGVVIALLTLSSLKTLSFLDSLLIIISAVLFELFFRVRIPLKTEEKI